MRTELALLAALAACSPSAADYGVLKGAAEARLGHHAAQAPRDSKQVARLLAQPLTAETATQIALANNPGIRAAVEEVSVAMAELDRVGGFPNPTVEGALRFRGEERPEIELAAMVDLTELAFSFSRASAARAEVDAAKLEALGRLLDLAFEVRRTFYEYQAALQALELRRTVVEALAASAQVAQSLRDAGNITALELANEQAFLEEARLTQRRAETAVAALRERLNTLFGLSGRSAALWRAADRLPEPPERELALDTLEREALRRSLDLEIARRRAASAGRRASVERVAGWLPELKAGVSAERDEAWGVGPAVELELPLFNQGQGEIGEADARRRQQQYLYAQAAVRVRAAARAAAARVAASRSALRHYREVLLPLKAKVLEETEREYNAMQTGVFELLRAKREQVETANGYVAELLEYWRARADAEQLLAGRAGSIEVDPSSWSAPGSAGAEPARGH